MQYTRDYIINKCKDALKDVKTFYTKKFINYRGRTSDTKELYTEIIAEFVLSNISVFESGIQTITRKESYKTPTHDGKIISSSRLEENIAKQMFGNTYDFVGEMIDYQTPLKSSKEDCDVGKIDLLAYDGNTLRILELKKPGSKETMLRCVLEGYTYLKTADCKKLLKSFSLPEDKAVAACPFVFKGDCQWQEMQETRPNLKKLMSALYSKPYYITDTGGSYTVTED